MAVVYELTVFDDDDVAELFDVSTDPGHARPYLKAPTGFPEQEINFAKGTASIGQVNVQIVDVPTDATDQDTGYLTAQLADGGYSALNGHRAVLTENIDGAGATKVIDGVIRSIRLLDTFSSYEIELRDIRERERKAKAFATTTTPTILPRGVLDGYGVQYVISGTPSGYPIGPTLPLKGTYRMDSVGNGGVIVIDLDVEGVLEKLQLTGPVLDALESVTELDGSPDVLVYDRWKLLWRDLAAGGAYTELTQVAHSHPDLAENPNRTAALRAASGAIQLFGVNNAISGDTLPADNQAIEFIVQYDGPVTEDWRFHLQDLTAGELLRNLYRGDYSVEDPRIRYDSAALLALATPVRLRLGKPVEDVREWAEKNIYPIVHAAPTLNADGEIAPITYLLPDADETLIDLNDANCRPSGGGWSQASDDAINIVKVTYERLYRVRSLDEAGQQIVALSDTLQTRKVIVEHRIQESIDLLGEQPLEIESELLSTLGTADGGPYFGDVVDEQGARVAERVSRMATDRFALGGQYFSLHCDRSDSDVEGLKVGSWVTVSVSWMPDYESAVRNLNRLAQVIGRRNLNGAWRALTLIDAGTVNAPLAGPTLGTVTADAAGVVSIPVTALGAGAEARVDYAISTPEPSAGSELWTFLGRVDAVPTTLTTPQITPNSTVWVRARSENIGRRPSVYTTAVSVVVVAIPRVLELFIRVDAEGVPTVEWRANAHTLGVRIAYEVHYTWELPTFGTSIDADVSDLSAVLATTVFNPKMISVRITAYPGWSGSAVTGSAGEATTERIIGALLGPGLYDVHALYERPTADDVTIRWTRNANTFAVWVYLKTLPLPVDGSDNPWPGDTTNPTKVLAIGTDEYVIAVPDVGSLSFLQLEPRGEDGEAGNGIRISIDPKAISIEEEGPTWSIDTESEGATLGTFAVQIHDPDGVMDDVYYRTKSGTGAWTAYALEEATPTDLDIYSRTVTMVERHLSFIEFRGRYTGANGVQHTVVIKSSGFDLGKIPNISVALTIDEDGILSANVQGDVDTASIKIVASVAGQPSDATARGATAKNGRMFTTGDIGTLLTLGKDETGYVTVFGYSETGGGGIESTESVKLSATFTTIEAPTWSIDTESEGATDGTFAVQLHDPDAVMDDVYYRTKGGTEDWSAYALEDATPTDLDTYSRTVAMIERHLSFIEFRGRYTIRGVQHTVVIKSSGFDLGQVPNIAVSLTIDEAGVLSANIQGDVDTASIKIAASTAGQPSDATTRGETAKNGRMFTPADIGTLLTLDSVEIGYVTVFGYSETGGGGIESTESVKLSATRATVDAPTWSIDTESEGATLGTFAVQIHDPNGVMDDVYYKTKEGTADWSAYIVEDTTPVDLDIYSRNVTMVEGHLSFVEFRGRYTVGSVQHTVVIKSSGFDLGVIPDFTMRALVDADWKASPELDGDHDMASAKIAFAVGVTPTEPTDTVVRARGTVDGRKISASDVNGAYGDIPVQLGSGQTCIFKAFGYGASGGGGEESNDAVTAVISRTPEPPGLLEVDALPFDDGSDIDWDLSFTFLGDVNTTDHQMNFQFFEDGVIIDSETAVAVDESQPFAYSSIGAGGFSAGKKYYAEVSLVSKSSGGVLGTLNTFPLFAAT
ncbi:MAG: hypothetical protein QGD93_02600 [Actinomycetota bacterium]|nr:hypothetical protein [Actinomycetota bacterium]